MQFSRVFCSPSEGAQSPGTLCRACTRVFVSSRLLPPSEGVQFSRVFCSPSEVPAFLFPAAFSHLPKVCSFPAFSAHLPKVRNRPGPSVGPVPAFSFPAAFSHLPKVCSFPAFSAHLPKVSSRLLPPSEGAQSHGTLFSAYARVSVSSRLFPPSEGGPNPAVSVSPLEGEHVYLFRNGSRFRISQQIPHFSAVVEKGRGGNTV